MRSDVSLFVCGDLPQLRGGPERQAVRRSPHITQHVKDSCVRL
jgi:hypothetical protein